MEGSKRYAISEVRYAKKVSKVACKPNSVLRQEAERRSSIWDGSYPPPLAAYPRVERRATSGREIPDTPSYLALLPVGFAWPARSPRPPVVFYTTFAPLPRPARIGPARRSFSVALSVGSPRLDVIQHRALWSSDFPQTARWPPATAQPPWTLSFT